MDFNLSEEQTMLREAALRFVRSEYSLEQRRRLIASGETFSRAHWAQFGELGWLMLNVPEAAGGLDASLIETSILMQAFGRGMVLEPYVSTAVLGAFILAQAEETSRASTLLAEIAVGEKLVALAHEEPSRSGDTYRGSTQARAAGDGFQISGNKFMALDAPTADVLIVSATLAGADNYALFLVDARADGVALSSYPLISGSSAADIDFTNTPALLLLDADCAATVLDAALDRAAVAWLSCAVGALDACLEICRDYVNTRQQFGQPLGKFQALQHILADMFVSTQESHSILFQALAFIDTTDVSIRRRAVSAAKIVIGEALQFVLGQGIQLHGGYGITDEYAVSHLYKYGLVLEKLCGDGDAHVRRFIAEGRD